MRFTAVGDILIQKKIPQSYKGLEEVKACIERADFKFFNLETTLNNGEFYASQFCGESYLRANPEWLKDIIDMGFNTVSICNNHSMDFSHGGLLKTLDVVNEYGLIQSGVGKNLAEAAAPNYIETPTGRIAIIGVTSSFKAPAKAGEQSRRFVGRPGVNGMRYDEIYHIGKEEMEQLKNIAKITKINGRDDVSRNDGYLEVVPEEYFDFKGLRFVVDEEHQGRVSVLDEVEMARIAKSIEEAKIQADYVMISIHNHQIRNGDKKYPDFFIEDFAKRCIDLGAHAIIGHGPHEVRGIQIYKNCPIFYSLGNFIFQNENIPYAPEEFYKKYGLTSDDNLNELFRKRSKNGTKGLQTKRESFETIVPYWEMEDGKLTYLELIPIEISHNENKSVEGLPKITEDISVLERVKELSECYGTQMSIENGKAIIKF